MMLQSAFATPSSPTHSTRSPQPFTSPLPTLQQAKEEAAKNGGKDKEKGKAGKAAEGQAAPAAEGSGAGDGSKGEDGKK